MVRLCACLPRLRGVYEEHVTDYDEVLPHVLMGDYVRHMLDEAESADRGGLALANAMRLLEEGMGSPDPLVQNLVAVSFLENLDEERSGFAVIRDLFGPHLEAQYITMTEWEPPHS